MLNIDIGCSPLFLDAVILTRMDNSVLYWKVSCLAVQNKKTKVEKCIHIRGKPKIRILSSWNLKKSNLTKKKLQLLKDLLNRAQVEFIEFSKRCSERWKTMSEKEKKRFNQVYDVTLGENISNDVTEGENTKRYVFLTLKGQIIMFWAHFDSWSQKAPHFSGHAVLPAHNYAMKI